MTPSMDNPNIILAAICKLEYNSAWNFHTTVCNILPFAYRDYNVIICAIKERKIPIPEIGPDSFVVLRLYTDKGIYDIRLVDNTADGEEDWWSMSDMPASGITYSINNLIDIAGDYFRAAKGLSLESKVITWHNFIDEYLSSSKPILPVDYSDDMSIEEMNTSADTQY